MPDNDLTAINANAEDIFGQYLYAVGAGAGLLWVRRSAIRALRENYFEYIVRALREGVHWEKDSARILSYMQTIGGLAADYSRAAGRHSITSGHMMRAVKKVEATVAGRSAKGQEGGPTMQGPWCPPDENGGG